MTKSYVIGVDAGGTKTTAWLAERNGGLLDTPLATGGGGPGNLRSAGFDLATTSLNTAISQATASCQGKVDCLCICAAGAGRPEEQKRLREWAELHQFASHVHIASDVEAVLAAVSEDSTGVALIAGTGSLAWGRNSNGKTHRAGGWGHLLGDEGGAYDISIKCLQHITRMSDGRIAETPLLQTVMRQLNLTHPSELVAKIYSESMSKDQVASLAKCVFELAESGDPVGAAIIDDAISELALMVKTVAERLELSEGFTLAVTGGVLIHQPTFLERLTKRIDHATKHTHVVNAPASGAVGLARLTVDAAQ